MISKLQYACSEFSKTLKTILNEKYSLADIETSPLSTLYKSMENFIKCLSTNSEVFNEAIELMKTNILVPIIKKISYSFQK